MVLFITVLLQTFPQSPVIMGIMGIMGARYSKTALLLLLLTLVEIAMHSQLLTNQLSCMNIIIRTFGRGQTAARAASLWQNFIVNY
jgi:hypothetical protein